MYDSLTNYEPTTEVEDGAYVFRSSGSVKKVTPGINNVIGSYKTKEDIVTGYADTIQQWYQVIKALGNHFVDQTVPLYGLFMNLYNYRVDDSMGSHAHNLIQNLEYLKTIEEGVYNVTHSFQTVYATMFTNTDDSKWMTDIVSLQPEMQFAEIKLDRQSGVDSLTGNIHFKCPTGILSKSMMEEIWPLEIQYLTITEAYLSSVDRTQYKFDRRKSSVKFRESPYYHLERDLLEGREVYKIVGPDKNSQEGWEGWDQAEDGTWNLPLAWWIEVSPELKNDLNAKLTYDFDNHKQNILSENERAHTRIGKINTRLNKQNQTVKQMASFLSKKGRFVLELNSQSVKRGYYV